MRTNYIHIYHIITGICCFDYDIYHNRFTFLTGDKQVRVIRLSVLISHLVEALANEVIFAQYLYIFIHRFIHMKLKIIFRPLLYIATFFSSCYSIN